MKIFFTWLLFVIPSLAWSQGNVKLHLTVVKLDNTPAPGLVVTAMETSSLKEVIGKTDAKGMVVMDLENGVEWAISIGEIKKCMYIASEPNRMMTSRRFLMYDPKDYNRRQAQDATRTNDKFKVIEQTVVPGTPFKRGDCFLSVNLHQPDGKPVPGMEISAVNIEDSLIYKALTNEKGIAHFILPYKKKYEVDVNSIKNFNYADFGDEYKIHNLYLIYAPTVTKEKIINDTTFQDLDWRAKPSSERTLMKLEIRGGKKNGIRERVFLRELNTNKVYTATTNDSAFVHFLIPTKHVYMVDFEYQKGADAINLKYASELTTGRISVYYAPDPRLEFPETFVPTPDRLLIKSFNEFLTKQFTKPKDKPFALEIKSVLKINKQSREALFKLTLAGSDVMSGVRLPLNAAFVLDKSGSMFQSDRDKYLKEALLTIGKTLGNNDVVSVVLFDDEASLVSYSKTNHIESIRRVTENFSPGGGTNIMAGFKEAIKALEKGFDPNKSNKLFLLTDGYDINPPKEVTDYVEEKFKKGFEFSTIGLGKDFNQSLLELIAIKGNGSFDFVDQSLNLEEKFSENVKNSISYLAKDVQVSVFHNDAMIFSSLYGYPVKEQKKGVVTFDIGKIPQTKNEMAFLKFKLNNPSPKIESEPLIIKVTYYDYARKQQVSYEQKVALEWTDETDTELKLDQEEKTLYAIAILNQSLKVMAEAHERKDTKAAKAALEDGKRQVKEIFPKALTKEVNELFDEVVRFLKLLELIEKKGG